MTCNICITEVSVQKNNPLRVNVYCEKGYLFSLDDVDAVTLGIKPGRILSSEELEKLSFVSEFGKAKDKALSVLSRKSVTRYELGKILIETFEPEVAENVLCELESLGYIDDCAYTMLFLEKAYEKLWGKKKIIYELSQKGIDRNTAEDVMEEAHVAGAEEIAEYMAVKYRDEDFSDFRTKQRVMRFFASRGFEYSEIDDAIKLYTEKKE